MLVAVERRGVKYGSISTGQKELYSDETRLRDGIVAGPFGDSGIMEKS